MFKELTKCYEGSARNFVRVVVDEETNVMYLTNKTTMIPMLAPDGKPSLYNEKVRIFNDTEKIKRLSQFSGWQNIFVNEADGTMFVGGGEILCQLIDKNGKPKIYKE